MKMKYIRTPTGEIFQYDECEIFDNGFCNKSEVFLNADNQNELSKELYENTGILVGELEGGENTG